MENVSRAWTSDRQTFVLVLFLNHLSPWIWREVLIGLPWCLRHVSFPPCVFTRATQGPAIPARAFDVTISRFPIWLLLLLLLFFLQSDDDTEASAGWICWLKTGPLFYWLRPFSLGQICCQQRLGAHSAEWTRTKEEALLCQTWRPEKVRVELSGRNRIRAISFGRGARTCKADFFPPVCSLIFFFLLPFSSNFNLWHLASLSSVIF